MFGRYKDIFGKTLDVYRMDVLFEFVTPLSSISPLLLYTTSNGPDILHFNSAVNQNGFSL